MTRGKLIWIEDQDGNCLVSKEYNGDMGISQTNGQLAFLKLEKCKTKDNFLQVVKKFNNDYDWGESSLEDVLYSLSLKNIPSCTFEKSTYFKNWF